MILMKNKLFGIIFLMGIIGSAKPLPVIEMPKTVPLVEYTSVKNLSWEDARKIPLIDKKLYKKIISQDFTDEVIMKYVDGVSVGNGYISVDRDIVIANGLYTYNTKLQNTKIFDGNDVNRVIFSKSATVYNNAVITLRTSISKNIGDSVTFENISPAHININVINTQDSNSLPRYKSLFLMSVPAGSNVSVSLGGNINVGGVHYKLSSNLKGGRVFYFLTPVFADETQRESVMAYEEEISNVSYESYETKDRKLRELVRIMTMDKSVGYSSVIDID
jgi:hypothetical protein